VYTGEEWIEIWNMGGDFYGDFTLSGAIFRGS
jgi:hypothetical protein